MKQFLKSSAVLLSFGTLAIGAASPTYAHHIATHYRTPLALLQAEPKGPNCVPCDGNTGQGVPPQTGSQQTYVESQSNHADFQYHPVETSSSYSMMVEAPLVPVYATEVHFERDGLGYGDYVLDDDYANYDAMVRHAKKRAKKRERDTMAYNYAQNFGGYGPARGYLKRNGIGAGLSYVYNGGKGSSKKRLHSRHHRHGGNPYAETFDPGLFTQYGNHFGGY